MLEKTRLYKRRGIGALARPSSTSGSGDIGDGVCGDVLASDEAKFITGVVLPVDKGAERADWVGEKNAHVAYRPRLVLVFARREVDLGGEDRRKLDLTED